MKRKDCYEDGPRKRGRVSNDSPCAKLERQLSIVGETQHRYQLQHRNEALRQPVQELTASPLGAFLLPDSLPILQNQLTTGDEILRQHLSARAQLVQELLGLVQAERIRSSLLLSRLQRQDAMRHLVTDGGQRNLRQANFDHHDLLLLQRQGLPPATDSRPTMPTAGLRPSASTIECNPEKSSAAVSSVRSEQHSAGTEMSTKLAPVEEGVFAGERTLNNKEVGQSRADSVTKKAMAKSATGGPSKHVLLSLGSDNETLNSYQCFVRKQVYFFQVSKEELKRNAQGRNKPIVLNQVGLMCRYCASLHASQRPRGSVYFPGSLAFIYQSVQNLVKNHFMDVCKEIPMETKERMQELREKKGKVWGGGRQYWVHASKMLGVVENDGCLFFDTTTSNG